MNVSSLSTIEPNLTDEEIVGQVLGGNTAMFEILMRRHNQLIYRVARSILREDAEAEDVMQEAYVRAYQNLRQFEGRAKFSTWLSRIAIHEALLRRQRSSVYQEPSPMPDGQQGSIEEFASPVPTPEQQACAAETRQFLERAIEKLPDTYRTVFVLRDVEEMDTEDAASVLGISEDAVKTRLHRARALLRRYLFSELGASAPNAFSFHATRCDRVVAAVFARIQELHERET